MRLQPLVYLGIGALTLAFAAVSLLLFLDGGRSYHLLRAKLKVGALLLMLQGLLATQACLPPLMTCYEAVMEDSIVITDPVPQGSEVLLDLDQVEPTLQGDIDERVSEHFSYRLIDAACAGIEGVDAGTADATAGACGEPLRGALEPADGAMDQREETFTLALDPELPAGRYALDLFNLPVDSVDDATFSRARYILQVVRTADGTDK